MEAVESVWRFVVCGLRWVVGGRKNQWLAACGGRSEESAAGRVSGGKSQWWEESESQWWEESESQSVG